LLTGPRAPGKNKKSLLIYMTDILYISKNFTIKGGDDETYKITNIDSNFIVLDDYLILTHEEFKKAFDIKKVIVY